MEIMSGDDYRDWVSAYIVANFSDRNIEVYQEVPIGKSVIGKNRKVDILLIDKSLNLAVALECKYQRVKGTADEKMPYALKDAESMQMDKYIVYGGAGWSQGVKHMLEAHELACFSEPNGGDSSMLGQTPQTRELDHILAMKFHWWDVLIGDKSPFSITPES